MGESISIPVRLQFDRRMRLELHAATTASDAGLLELLQGLSLEDGELQSWAKEEECDAVTL